MDIVHSFKPLDHLDQAIYRDILKVKNGKGEDFQLVGVTAEAQQIVLEYEVRRLPGENEKREYTSLVGLAAAGALLARAALTRKPHHWAQALSTAGVALLGGEETLSRARSAIERLSRGGKLGTARLRIAQGEAVLTYRDQEIHMSLPPMKNVVLRTFRRALGGKPTQSYAVHIDLQDGRILSLNRWNEPLSPRRVGHQVAAALQLSMVFQNVEVTEVTNGFSWEMGPQLVEPALN